jgi:hypothetical protein
MAGTEHGWLWKGLLPLCLSQTGVYGDAYVVSQTVGLTDQQCP